MSADNIVEKINSLDLTEGRLPNWMRNLKPLDRSIFPDTADVEDFIRLDLPRSLRNRLEDALEQMGLTEEYQRDIIFEDLKKLRGPKVKGRYVLDHPMTLGELRSLTPEALNKIDRIRGDTDYFAAEVISRLFGLVR